jgi:hypothetical protein
MMVHFCRDKYLYPGSAYTLIMPHMGVLALHNSTERHLTERSRSSDIKADSDVFDAMLSNSSSEKQDIVWRTLVTFSPVTYHPNYSTDKIKSLKDHGLWLARENINITSPENNCRAVDIIDTSWGLDIIRSGSFDAAISTSSKIRDLLEIAAKFREEGKKVNSTTLNSINISAVDIGHLSIHELRAVSISYKSANRTLVDSIVEEILVRGVNGATRHTKRLVVGHHTSSN